MNTKKRNSGFPGFGTYALFILLVVLIWYMLTGNSGTSTWTKAEFETALVNENVVNVVISQNREIPTGSVQVLLKDESKKTLYISDVNEVQEMMDFYDFTSYTCKDVPQESWLMTLLPYLLMFGAFKKSTISSNSSFSS